MKVEIKVRGEYINAICPNNVKMEEKGKPRKMEGKRGRRKIITDCLTYISWKSKDTT